MGFFSLDIFCRARISGVDSYVRNVDAAGSNPAGSIFVFFRGVREKKGVRA